MSLTGFFKQINKANQLISEKIGGAKGTDLDDRFNLMEWVSHSPLLLLLLLFAQANFFNVCRVENGLHQSPGRRRLVQDERVPAAESGLARQTLDGQQLEQDAWPGKK
jgi:hypothetical protein